MRISRRLYDALALSHEGAIRLDGAVVEDLFTLAPAVGALGRRKKGPLQTSSRKITFITEQSYELLDEKSREALTKQNGPVVDRTWLFDSISWYAPQDFVAYDAIRRR